MQMKLNLIARILPVLLAVVLQVMPLVRNLFVNPATGANMAFILRWGIGSTAVLGAVDAVSGATTPYFQQPFQTNVVLSVGTFYTNNLIVTNIGVDPGAYFDLTNKAGLDSGQIGGGFTTTVCLPPGLTLKCFDTASKKYIYAAIYGTPTAAFATSRVTVDAGFSGAGDIYTNLFFTVIAGSTPPAITSQPLSRTNLTGTIASFSVTNSGTAPLQYQWYFNTNTALLNATNTSLSLTNVQLAAAGTYSVIITNTAGSVTSSPALLTVWQPPVITNQPVGTTNVAGSTVSFSVVAGGTAPLKYQWYFNANLAQLNATNLSLGITNVHLSHAGTYTVVITNIAGAITSSPALLGVTLPASPALTTPTTGGGGGGFQFTFVPAVGLTNTVQTNGALSGGVWATLTNVPPPANASPVTVTDPFGTASRFYRVMLQP